MPFVQSIGSLSYSQSLIFLKVVTLIIRSNLPLPDKYEDVGAKIIDIFERYKRTPKCSILLDGYK